MKVKTLASAIIAVGFAATSAVSFAADQGHGTVKFTGTIIDAPCSISPESQNQTVDMGQVANSALAGGKKSAPRPFTIELLGCAISTKNTVSATFTGQEASNPDLLQIKGQSVGGASLAIADSNGELIKLGQPSPVAKLSNGNETLKFSAYLQGNMTPAEGENPAKGDDIALGAFETEATFALTYQ